MEGIIIKNINCFDAVVCYVGNVSSGFKNVCNYFGNITVIVCDEDMNVVWVHGDALL